MKKDQQFIGQLDHYCDLWCERCRLSEFCGVYLVVDRADAADPWGFVERQTQSILQIQTLWLAVADQLRIPVKPPEFFRIADASSPRLSARPIRRLIRQARSLNLLLGQLVRQSGPKALRRAKGESMADVLDEVIWHKIQVHFRLALAGIVQVWEGERPEARFEGLPRSDGLAKSALVSADRLERGLKALARSQFAAKPNPARLISDLRNLRRNILEIFPSAPDFIRPGFDESVETSRESTVR